MSAEARFWSKVEKTDGCWIWLGYPNRQGYGTIQVDGVRVRAHRFSWSLLNGPIPDGLCVLHTCDNPSCVRPDHLFLGTNLDNIKDRMGKQRSTGSPGETHPLARLTNEQVYEIRRVYGSGHIGMRKLAQIYGVERQLIQRIVKRISYVNV